MRASFIGGPRINNLRNSLAGKSNGRKRERERERGRKKEEKKRREVEVFKLHFLRRETFAGAFL